VCVQAHQAGVECGDILRKVDGTDVLAMNAEVSEREEGGGAGEGGKERANERARARESASEVEREKERKRVCSLALSCSFSIAPAPPFLSFCSNDARMHTRTT
jgi:hypothetical protein